MGGAAVEAAAHLVEVEIAVGAAAIEALQLEQEEGLRAPLVLMGEAAAVAEMEGVAVVVVMAVAVPAVAEQAGVALVGAW